MMENKVENPHNGPSAMIVYDGGGYMAFKQNGPPNEHYLVCFPKKIVCCPGTPGATYIILFFLNHLYLDGYLWSNPRSNLFKL